MRDAVAHIKQIFIWSLISATVSNLLALIQRFVGTESFIGRIIIGLIGGVWNVITFFTFPMMILENKGPKEAIKESGELFKKTWGERATLFVGMGIIFALAIFGLLALCIGISLLLAQTVDSGIFIGAIVVLFFIFLIVLILVQSTCESILRVILLHYARKGTLPDGLQDKQEFFVNLSETKTT